MGKPKKPDITGQRFGRLTVLGEGIIIKNSRGKSRRLWDLRCDCGTDLSRERYALDSGNMLSCGCKKKEHKGPPRKDITGQRFGHLTAISPTENRDKRNKPAWLLSCDCGGSVEFSISRLASGYNLRCDRVGCVDGKWLEYPVTPTPYPKEAGELAAKYLHLCTCRVEKFAADVEDVNRDRLLRACWILTYRRSQGEVISELHEKRFIRKHLRYTPIDVFWKHKLEAHGGFLVTINNEIKTIGDGMTDLTFSDYPVSESETQGTISLSKRKLSFRRR